MILLIAALAAGVSAFAQSTVSSGSDLNSSQSKVNTNSIQSSASAKPKENFIKVNYWSMYSGPVPGQSLGSRPEASQGNAETGANFFQSFFLSHSMNEKNQFGAQLRTNTDFAPGGLEVLNPRLFYARKNVIDNSWVNLSLQPFIEIPITKTAKSRTQITSLLLAHNWTFKSRISNLTLSLVTMTNFNFYQSNAGFREYELVAMPSITYQLSKDFQFLSWAWFDRSNIDGWNDDYLRAGINYSVLSNLQLFPCVQVFTDSLRASNTSLGLELAAQF
jgi:hypothetical protein